MGLGALGGLLVTFLGLCQLDVKALLVHLQAVQPLFYILSLASSLLQLCLDLHSTMHLV